VKFETPVSGGLEIVPCLAASWGIFFVDAVRFVLIIGVEGEVTGLFSSLIGLGLGLLATIDVGLLIGTLGMMVALEAGLDSFGGSVF
jgi:hypothetical protein